MRSFTRLASALVLVLPGCSPSLPADSEQAGQLPAPVMLPVAEAAAPEPISEAASAGRDKASLTPCIYSAGELEHAFGEAFKEGVPETSMQAEFGIAGCNYKPAEGIGKEFILNLSWIDPAYVESTIAGADHSNGGDTEALSADPDRARFQSQPGMRQYALHYYRDNIMVEARVTNWSAGSDAAKASLLGLRRYP